LTVDSWQSVTPASQGDFAAALGDASVPVRFRGGGTKLHWGAPTDPALELSTLGLDRIVEHNAGDLTAVLEPGVPLARAQETFAGEDQMLALDPPDPGGTTIGGLVATADSGPLRSRYGGARDLVVGITVALSDGTVARAGGKVIKNVAGYDIAKLFAGSYGTLGAILELSVRLHPLAPGTATAAGGTTDGAALARAASAMTHAPLEHVGLDVRWGGGDGAVLARFGGATAREQAEAAGRVIREAGIEPEIVDDDDSIWSRQREGQRSDEWAVMRVSATQTALPRVMELATRVGARVVGRAPLGVYWLVLSDRSPAEAGSALAQLRAELAPSPCVLLDAPAELRGQVDPWGPVDPAVAELARRVKERFDPAGVCNPGVYVGGI
jgi:glycolate dehydrogenase FAD-binding subunit